MGKPAIPATEKETPPASTYKAGLESRLGLGDGWKTRGPMSILLLTDSFSPHAGGSREYYYNLFSQLVALGGAKVAILTKKVPGWKSFDKKHSSTFFRIRRRFKPLKSLKYDELPKGIFPFLQAICRIVRDSPRIIHAGDLYPPGLIAWVINRLTGIPYVIYSHGEEITQTDRYRYQPRVRDCIYKGAAAVVANSEFTRKELLRIGVSENRIVKITPGVDAVRFRPEPADKKLMAQYNLAGKTVVLTVARLVPRKGHRAALQAFAKVCGEFPEAHYLIAGTGPEEQKLRQFSEELGIQRRVSFTGYIPSEVLPKLYNLCDIMLLANREEEDGDVEGFGIVFLEANAAGKPVIGGRSGGAIEAVADGVTGFLVDPDNPAELEGVLRELLRDPKLRQTSGAAGRRRVESEFDWKQRAHRLHEVNCRVLNEPLATSNSGVVPGTQGLSQGRNF
jgi:phosphatidylinositol alpha-1,6-mannosyltransferase